MEQVFANDENAILESDDKHQLETRLKTARPLLDEEEKRLTTTSLPNFGAYLSNNEKMMRRSMIRNARKESWYAHQQNGKCFEVLHKPVRDSK